MSEKSNKTLIKYWFIVTIIIFVGSTLASYLLRVVYLKDKGVNWGYVIIFSIIFPIVATLNEKYKEKIWK